MNMFTSKDRLINKLEYPLSLLGFVMALLLLLLYLPNLSLSLELISSFVWCCACSLIGIDEFNNSKKVVSLAVSLVLFNGVFFSITGKVLGYFIILVTAYLMIKVVRYLELEYMFMVSAFILCVIGVLFGVIYDYTFDVVEAFATHIKGNSMAFGVVSQLYSVLFGSSFSDLFYYTDFGYSQIVGDSIVSGAINIFNADKSNPASVTSVYLTGQYFSNIFLSVGAYFSLFQKIKKTHLLSFSLALNISVLLGNNTVLLLFLLLYNPLIFIGYLFCSGILYLVSSLVDIRIGFEHSASIVELILNANKIGYFLIIGIVSVVLIYFVIQLVLSRFDFDNTDYLPREVRHLVKSLGGKENIQRVENGLLYVYNPNLINILNVDCEIHQNVVSLISSDYELLNKYF